MWPALEPLFAKVTCSTDGCYEPEDVLNDILASKQALWVAYDAENNRIDAAMTTAIDQTPRRKVCKIIFITGSKMREWKDEFIAYFEQYARDNGATLCQGYFRSGWVRMWPGSRISGATITKELR